MNEHLAKALKELEDAHAEGIPSPDEVIDAPDETEWSGAIGESGHWTLIKNSIESYTSNTSSGY